MAQLHLFVFGPPRLVAADQPVDLSLRKAAALLVYLAVTAQPHSRDTLATMLWPEHSQREARANLRRTLYRLRELVPAAVQEVEPDALAGSPGGALWLDCARFEHHVAAGLAAPGVDAALPERLEHFLAAAELYAGDFLAGWSLPDCPAFDEWQFFERERLRAMFAHVLAALVEGYEAQGGLPAAIGFARRWLALDQFDEAVHRRLMRLYAQAGQASAALRQYGACVRLLEAELGAPPDEETTALYEAIRSNRFPARDDAAVSDGAALPATRPRFALPADTTPFIGRDVELAQLTRLLHAPAGRLVTVVGPGGIGKTRLALAAAAAVAEGFADGVVFVALAALTSAEPMVAAVAGGLHLQLAATAPPREQLLAFLRSRRLLLVLDNCEQVQDGAGLVAEILEAAPKVRVLATSRVRLNLSGEAVYRLDGMPYPEHASQRDALDYGAVQLLMQSARLARPAFEPRGFDLEQMIRICRLVAGMPLALVLAASWLELLPFREIADEIERSLDFLATSAIDVPVRQRSVRAAIEASWQRLPPAEQQLFMRLSVFRGGFTRRAALAVAGASLPSLRTLLNTSFVSVDENERYAVHELLRQYGAERLLVSGDADPTRDAHAAFFLIRLRDAVAELKGPQQLPALQAIAIDLDNVLAAWDRAVEQHDAPALAQAAQSLCLYHEMRGALTVGQAAFGRAVAAFSLRPPDQPRAAEHNALRGWLLICHGTLLALGGRLPDGQSCIEQGLSVLNEHQRHEHHEWRAFGSMWLSWTLFLQSKTARAEQMVTHSLTLYALDDDRWGKARNLFVLGNSLTARGRLAESEPPLLESLALYREIGDRRSCLLVERNLAILSLWFGEYAQTGQLLDQAAQLSREFDDRLGLAYTLREQGKLDIAQGRYDRALHTLEQSVALTDEIGSAWESAATLDDLGVALRVRGEHEAAERVLRTCLDAATAIDNRYYTARCLGDLGCVAADRGALEQAEHYLRQALELWTTMGHEPYQAWVLSQLGHVLGQASDDRAAQQCYGHALRLAMAHNVVPCVLDIFVGAAALLARSGRVEQAAPLLSVAQQHAAGSYETRARARSLHERLAHQLPSTPRGSAGTAPDDWRPLAMHLLTTLPSPSGHPPPA